MTQKINFDTKDNIHISNETLVLCTIFLVKDSIPFQNSDKLITTG